MKGLRVKWTEYPSMATYELASSWFPDEDLSELNTEREGEVIDTERSFWGDTYLIVACTDNKIRKCRVDAATIIK